ncbi:MAG: ribosome small subunit-dependent GTPase A [Bacteroidota bacterium]
MTGTVIKSTGSWYQVMIADNKIYDCKIRGSFRIKGIKATNPIAAGDIVDIELEPDEMIGNIVKIHERKNYIIRKSINLSKQVHILAANIDHAYLVGSIAQPKIKFGFIDRFLVTAEAYHIPATIILNKTDANTEEDNELMKHYKEMYEKIGYEVICMSAFNNEDVERLKIKLKGKINLFSGNSGVGKSTLINKMELQLNLKTAEISTSNEKGTHTTTFAEMHPLTFGGYIIDTPGIKELGVVDIDKKEVSHYFLEMRERLNDCKFSNCTHINEPGCAIKKAVEAGEISPTRYSSYLDVYENREEEEDNKY